MIFILLEIIQIYLQIGNGIHYFTEDVNKVMAIFIIKVFRTIAFINNKDEDNSSKTLNDKNQQASSQKFKQLSNGKFYISSNVHCFSHPLHIIIIITIYSLEFFKSALADNLSLKFEWQQVSSSLKDSAQYSGCSQ